MSQFWLTGQPNNNQHIAGNIGSGTDFFRLMTDPAAWSGIYSDTAVLQVYEAFVQVVAIAQQESFYAWAAKNDIKLSFNTGVSTLDDPNVAQYISQFVSLGGSVSYLTMDEPLFVESEDAAYDQVSIEQLAANVAASIAQIETSAPNPIIVDQEPVPITPPSELASWCTAYAQATGAPLAGMQLDVDWNWGTATWEPALVAAVDTLEALGVPPAIIINSEEPTDLGWTDGAINHYLICRSLFANTIPTYAFQTWNPNPTYLLSDTAPGALADVEYAATFYDQVALAYQSTLSRAPTQTELFSAMRALGSGIVTTAQVYVNLQTSGVAIPETAVYQDTRARLLSNSTKILTISSSDETVIAGDTDVTITCPILDVSDDIVGFSTADTVLSILGAGTILPGWAYEPLVVSGPIQLGDLTNNVTLKLSSDETLDLDPARNFMVVARGTADVINGTWDTTLDVSGVDSTTLDLTCSGSIAETGHIMGVGTLLLTQAGIPFSFLADDQANQLVQDQSGGDTITIGDSSQTFINNGTASDTVYAISSNADAHIIGGGAGATLNVTTAGFIALADDDNNLIVNILHNSQLVMNNMQFITADATSGNDLVVVGNSGQVVLAGQEDIIVAQPSDAYKLIGTASELSGDIMVGLAATIDIVDFAPNLATVSEYQNGSIGVVAVQEPEATLTFTVVGSPLIAFTLSPDGAGGTLLEYRSHVS